jgi:hypothetical protein
MKRPFDAEVVEAVLTEAGWKPARGQGLAEGLAWLVQRSGDLDYLEHEHNQVRDRLSERVDQVDELRAKFRKEQKARLRLADRFRTLEERCAELELRLRAGWEVEHDRLQAQVRELKAAMERNAEALDEIEDSDHCDAAGHTYSAVGHKWCVNRAMRARKAWMPCAGCLVSHRCVNAYDERNRGRMPQVDCLWSPEEGFTP